MNLNRVSNFAYLINIFFKTLNKLQIRILRFQTRINDEILRFENVFISNYTNINNC
jgi:hypothetical protein